MPLQQITDLLINHLPEPIGGFHGFRFENLVAGRKGNTPRTASRIESQNDHQAGKRGSLGGSLGYSPTNL